MRLLESLLRVRRDRIGFIRAMTAEFGDVVQFRLGHRRLILINDPAAARQVLVTQQKSYRKGLGLREAEPLFGEGLLTSDGAAWGARRKVLQKAFDRSHLAEFCRVSCTAADELLARWRAAPGDGIVDAPHEMTRFTLAVLGRTFLRADLESRAEEIAADLHGVDVWAMQRMAAVLRLPLAVPTPGNLRARRSLARLEALAAVIAAAPPAVPAADVVTLLRGGSADEDGKALRDEILTFLVAGSETAAATLTWALHLLATHPEVQERLGAELAAALGGRPPELEDLDRLELLKAVVSETLRLYPAVWMITRRAIAEDQVAGYAIPAGADLLVSVYSIQRHPRHWSAPDEFQPDRFLDPQGEASSSPAFFPFGLGPRACVGRVFGQVEVQLALARILQGFRLERVDAGPVEPEPLLTLRPRRGLRLRVVPRAPHQG